MRDLLPVLDFVKKSQFLQFPHACKQRAFTNINLTTNEELGKVRKIKLLYGSYKTGVGKLEQTLSVWAR